MYSLYISVILRNCNENVRSPSKDICILIIDVEINRTIIL